MIESAPIKKKVLREEIKKNLIDAIIRGEIKPGDRLVETQLAKSYRVSQSPVREAIRDLEQVGIVVTESYKGTYIKKLTVKSLCEVYDVRAELEGLAMKLAIPRMTEKEIRDLEDIYDEMRRVSESGDFGTQILLDIKFHEFIIKSSGNDTLERTWSGIAYWTFFGMFLFKEKNDLLTRHTPIIQAIRDKKIDLGVELIRGHFLELKDILNKLPPNNNIT